MIITQCTVCGKTVFVAESKKEQRNDSRSTHYWSYEDDGSKRPYCDAVCGLVDYQK